MHALNQKYISVAFDRNRLQLIFKGEKLCLAKVFSVIFLFILKYEFQISHEKEIFA